MKANLVGGGYYARSPVADAQRCINLFPEQNPSDASIPGKINPVVHYPTAGHTLLMTLPEAPVRGLYRATDGTLMAAAGKGVYEVTYSAKSGWAATLLGSLTTSKGQVSMQDNGTDVIIVDGSQLGYTYNLGDKTWAKIQQYSFYGSDRVSILDGYFVLTYQDKGEMYISGLASTTFDGLDFTAKNGYPDKLQTCAVVHREIWMLGEDTTEIWMNTGDSSFTFGRIPGVFIQHGIAAVHSAASAGNSLFWLSKDPQGACVVIEGANYAANRVSTHAIENEFQTYSDVSDAIGFTWQMGGHVFYVLTFPTADKTWVFDIITRQWHEWSWRKEDGSLHRHRANCFVHWEGFQIIGDWENGNLYNLSADVFTDNGAPIVRIRSFPHLLDGRNNARMTFREFVASVETGNVPTDRPTEEPQLRLRWSDDGGRAWGNYISGGFGRTGEYLTNVQYQRLGMGRNRVWELSWSTPLKTALLGAYIQYEVVNQ